MANLRILSWGPVLFLSLEARACFLLDYSLPAYLQNIVLFPAVSVISMIAVLELWVYISFFKLL